MNIYFFSPIEGKSYLLFNTLIDTFVKKGHTIVSEINNADTVFFDWYSGLGRYDVHVLNYILEHRLNLISFDAKDYGAMSKEYFYMTDLIFTHHRDFKKLIYFIRKGDKTLTYPDFIYPYELVMYPDHIFSIVTKEELFERPNDIFFIGNTSPTRRNICSGLQEYFKCDFVIGEERIPHDQWLNRARQSKLFISACGGGFSDERVYQLSFIAPQLRNKNNQLRLNDFEDMEDCIEVSENPTPGDIQKIKSVISNSYMLHDLYLRGVDKMNTYYNSEYRANYILNILNKNGIN